MRGYLYILTNQAFPGLIKIGYTDRDPNVRVAELSNTSVPFPFVLAYEILVNKPDYLETLVHSKLNYCRQNTSREFFKCTVSDAIVAIHPIIVAHNIQVINQLNHQSIYSKQQAITKEKDILFSNIEAFDKQIINSEQIIAQSSNKIISNDKIGFEFETFNLLITLPAVILILELYYSFNHGFEVSYSIINYFFKNFPKHEIPMISNNWIAALIMIYLWVMIGCSNESRKKDLLENEKNNLLIKQHKLKLVEMTGKRDVLNKKLELLISKSGG